MTSDDDRAAGIVFANGGLSWTRVRTPRIFSQIGKALLAIGAIAGMMAARQNDVVELIRVSSVISAIWLFITSYILSLTQTGFAGTLAIHPDHVAIETTTTRRVIPNARIRSAMVVDREMFGRLHATVEIEIVNGDILVARLPNPGAASAIVDALGFGAGGARVHASLAKPTRRLLHPLFAAVSLVCTAFGLAWLTERLGGFDDAPGLGALVFLAYPLVALALYAVAQRLVRAPEVTAGDDGVLVKGRLTTRFIACREIKLVGGGLGLPIFIETHAGERIRIKGTLLDDARRTAIARVIEERSGAAAAGAERFAHYERGGRGVSEWRAHLALSMNEASYRVHAATVDEAAAVLRSAQATAEQRVGAALALRVAGQPKERILVAADAAVDDRIREALEAVVEADDDEPIERALRRLPC